ncbi:hypothetical protein BC827DRAFT_1378332 [Russula dissimulans]|nr:hypothetical protein BC827DRAFT_1378332 [Russula dissimulans]
METTPDVEAHQEPAPRQRRRAQGLNYSSLDNGKLPNFAKYGDTSATYWKLYVSEANVNDRKFIESLRGDTGSMVFLNSIFSSIVASFIIEIYKTLLPDSGQQSVGLLSQLVKNSNPSQSPSSGFGPPVPDDQPFNPPLSPFADFFYTVYTTVGATTRYCLIAALAVYTVLSISPLIASNSPYNTPLTPLLRASGILLLYAFRFTLRLLGVCRETVSRLTERPYIKGMHFHKAQLLLSEAERHAEKLEPYAMEWLFRENDFSDKDMDTFQEGLEGYMSSRHTKMRQLDKYLTEDYMLKRIKVHFMTCITSLELSDEASITRVWRCIESLRLIFQHNLRVINAHQRLPDSDQSTPKIVKTKEISYMQNRYLQGIIDDFNDFCDLGAEPIVALRAARVRALAVQGLLSQLVQGAGGGNKTPNRPFTVTLIPWYTFLFPKDNKDIIQRLINGDLINEEDHKRIWEALLYGGPLVNLTILAKAVRLREHAPPSSLSFCWKALDILLTQLTIPLTEVSPSTRSLFEKVRKDTREYVRGKEQGFRITPLLKTLDAVARGWRLSKAFSYHPEYHSRVDLVFRKEKIWNRDILEAFACCLPEYVANTTPEELTEYMKGILLDNDLWTNLQVSLWNARQSGGPTHEKLRVFEDCCTVLDVAFPALERSSKVDWVTPEFGSLAQHFELFITHCFQGVFMGKLMGFRVGIIKAWFCKAILAQFRNDVDRQGTILFRPHWDITCLAKLLCSFGIGDSEGAEFSKSYISGGNSGAEFTTKAHELVGKAVRDGPLLIFCQLVRLATMAVPLNGSGLEAEDIAKVLELQRNIILMCRVLR